MLHVFGSIKSLLKLDPICIDNNVFRLHYKVSVVILVVSSLLVTSRQFIGDPISCFVEGVPMHLMNQYCWTHATFTIPNRNGIVGKEIVQPGVSSHVHGEEVKYYKYYQWVCFCLFFQAILFYVPRYLWKIWEGGRIKMLVLDLNCLLVSEDRKTDRRKFLLEYFIANLHSHNSYAFRFFLCEVLNFVNVVGQIYLVDYFLDDEFTTYSLDVLKFTETESEKRVDPISRIFPKITKCTFYKHGASGTIENVDGLCVLPINNMNEKIYVFLWFWLMILSVLSGLSLVFRVAVVAVPKLRLILLRLRSRQNTQEQIKTIFKKCEIGDWFILYQVAKNIDPLIYKQVIADLAVNSNIKA